MCVSDIKQLMRENIENKIESNDVPKEYYKGSEVYVDEEILHKMLNLSTECEIYLLGDKVSLDNKNQIISFDSSKEAFLFENRLYKKGYDEITVENNILNFSNNEMLYYFTVEEDILKIRNICIKGYFSLFDEGIKSGDYIKANEL